MCHHQSGRGQAGVMLLSTWVTHLAIGHLQSSVVQKRSFPVTFESFHVSLGKALSFSFFFFLFSFAYFLLHNEIRFFFFRSQLLHCPPKNISVKHNVSIVSTRNGNT